MQVGVLFELRTRLSDIKHRYDWYMRDFRNNCTDNEWTDAHYHHVLSYANMLRAVEYQIESLLHNKPFIDCV